MRMTRQVAAAVVVALAVVSAGCVGVLTGSEAFERTASPATVADGALDSTGYELAAQETVALNRTITVAGQSREVRATNQLTQYQKTLDLGPLGEQNAAVFATFTTPAFEIAGQPLNPIGEMSHRQLVGQLQSQYSDIRIGETVDTRTVTGLGEQTEVSTFAATGDFKGTTIDLRVHVTTIRHGDDYVVAFAVHPKRLDETRNVDALLRDLDHQG